MPFDLSLWEILLIVLAVAFVGFWSYRSLVLLVPWRRWMITTVRVALVLLVLLAVLEIQWKRKTDELAVLFVLDYSDSVSLEAKKWAMDYLRAAADRMSSDDLAALLVFGEETYVEVGPSPKNIFSRELDRIDTAPTTTYTNIARAIRLALAVFPEGAQRRIVLLTDGEENLGDARSEALVAASGEAQIHVIPLEEARGRDVLIDRLILPSRMQQDTVFETKILLNSTDAGPARVRFFQDGHYLGQKEVELQPGKNVFSFPQKIERPGFHTFEARVEALGDSRTENNTATGFTVVEGPPSILYISGIEAGQSLSPVPRYLEREGMLVDLRGPGQPPAGLSELQNYDCVALDNVPAEVFSTSQMLAFERYVRDLGGGLVMIGGRDSFGPGGYLKTPIEEALPVYMHIEDKRHFPSFAQVILIDKSGSMGMTAPSGKQKIEIAAEGAIRTLELLTDRDYIGVNATDTQPKWVSPIRKATNKKGIAGDIATLRAGGGGIYVKTGLTESYEKLRHIDAMIRHVIIFADGQDSEQQEGCYQLADRMVQENMTISTVSLGRGRDAPFLKNLAERTGGRFHLTEDIDQVPKIFTKETILARKNYFIEESFAPVRTSGNEILLGIEELPNLEGYVGSTLKERAELVLMSHKEDPVLAAWRYGLGKSVAFTSDARPRWASNWIGWEGFGKFWTQAVRWAMRGQTAAHLETSIQIVQGEGRLVVDALDQEGNFLNFLQLKAKVVSPSLETFDLEPVQTAPGRYEATFPARETGAYLASVLDDTAGAQTRGQQDMSGTALSYPVEFKPGGRGASVIQQLVETTGGEVLRTDEELAEVFRHDLQVRRAVIPVWDSLIWLAILLLPVDIAIRRVTITLDQWAALSAWLAVWNRWRQRQKQAVEADATLSQLKGVKQSLETGRKEGPPAAARSEESARLAEELRRAMDERRRAPVSAGPIRKKEEQEAENDKKKQAPLPPEEQDKEGFTSRLLDAKRRARQERTSGKDTPNSS